MSYDEEPHDYGFDLPDVRDEYISKDGGKVSIVIVRHWYQPDEDYEATSRFKVSFNIIYDNEVPKDTEDGVKIFVRNHVVTELPIGVDESKAYDIAHLMYEEDVEASDSIRELRAMENAERRMGA